MSKVTVEIEDDDKGGVLCAVVDGHSGRGAAYYAALYVQQQLQNTGTTVCPGCNGVKENQPCSDCCDTGAALLEPGNAGAKRLLIDALITENAPDPLTDEVIAQMTAEIQGENQVQAARTFRITHHYDIGNQDVFIMRRSGDVDGLRAALYCQFKSEDWFPDEGSALTNLGIAAMLVMHYGFRQVAETEHCTTIDMYSDRDAACGPMYRELMADASLYREGLRESMTNFFD